MSTNEVARQSARYFDQGFFCAESVLLAVSNHYGIHAAWLPKIATGFCSGVARTGGLCGAYSGAVMAISLLTGRQSPSDPLEPTYRAVDELTERFVEQFGATGCRQLIGCRLNTPEGQRYFNENNLIVQCREYTQAAAVMALEIIQTILADEPDR